MKPLWRDGTRSRGTTCHESSTSSDTASYCCASMTPPRLGMAFLPSSNQSTPLLGRMIPIQCPCPSKHKHFLHHTWLQPLPHLHLQLIPRYRSRKETDSSILCNTFLPLTLFDGGDWKDNQQDVKRRCSSSAAYKRIIDGYKLWSSTRDHLCRWFLSRQNSFSSSGKIFRKVSQSPKKTKNCSPFLASLGKITTRLESQGVRLISFNSPNPTFWKGCKGEVH